MQRVLRQLVVLTAMVSISAVLLAVSTPAASASVVTYCSTVLYPGESCSSGWGHIENNQGSDHKASRETCIDEYLDGNNNGRYTGATCEYYEWEITEQWPGGEWGYSRAWDGGSIYHYVSGVMRYY